MTLMAEPKSHKGTEHKESGVSLASVRDAIQSTYPGVEGDMIVRQVSKSSDTTWYRVNWYKKGDFGMYIHYSRFLALRKTPEGFAVEDQTVRPRAAAGSLN